VKITVKIKNLYGNEHIYPEDEAARIFARIAGQKTLTKAQLICIRELGYAIETKKESKRDWEGV